MLKINAVYINICVCCYYSQPVAAILFTHGTSGSASALIFSHRYNKIFAIPLAFITRLSQAQSKYLDNRFTFKNIYQRRSIFLVRCIRKRRQQIVEYSSNTCWVIKSPAIYYLWWVTDFHAHGLKMVVYIFERKNSPNYSNTLLTSSQQ